MVDAPIDEGRIEIDHPPAPAAAAPGKPSIWTKFSYGFGSVAFGVKDNGFSYFLLLFYTQVIGVDARLVGLAITIALVLDAIIDPAIGYWSDNLRSRWGRRHPFLYGSAVPIAACYFLLWAPPAGWSDQSLFWYLLGMAVLIRVFIAFCEIPSQALGPELTDDYDERSSLMSWRYYFGWTGGNAMTVMMFMFLFPAFATAAITDGRFNPEAYRVYGVVGSVVIFASVLISAAGTHSRIAHLKAAPPKRKLTLGKIFKEMFETLMDRSFIALFIAAMLGAVASGLSAALAFYFQTYFWGFTSQQIGWTTFAVFGSAIIGAYLAPVATRTMGKKKGAIIIGLIAFVGSPLPIFLKLLGLMPPTGSDALFWIVLVAGMIDVGLIICFQILSASMLADLVEQAELKTGRRNEGVFFAAATFIRKMVNGLGVMTATFVLAAARFPAGASPDQVPADAVFRLGAYYVPTILILWMAMMAVMFTYRIDRAGHEDNLRKLAAQRAK